MLLPLTSFELGSTADKPVKHLTVLICICFSSFNQTGSLKASFSLPSNFAKWFRIISLTDLSTIESIFFANKECKGYFKTYSSLKQSPNSIVIPFGVE